jgi:hypothetical protein
METFESLEKFDEFGAAEDRAKQLKGVVISYSIDRRNDGRYDVDVRLESAFDGLTDKVFVVTENGNRVREVEHEDENFFYEEADEKDNSIELICNSFLEAKETVVEIVEKIAENRKKVRESKQEEYGCVVF